MRRRHRWLRKDEALSNLVCEADLPESRRRAQRKIAWACTVNPRGCKRTAAGAKVIKKALAQHRRKYLSRMKAQAQREALEAQWPCKVEVPPRLAGLAEAARELVE